MAKDREPEIYGGDEAWSGAILYVTVGNCVWYRTSPDGVQNLETALSVRAGCVIRSERRGSNFTWTVDGKSFAHDPSTSLSECASYVPFIARGGKWWISNIEYEEVEQDRIDGRSTPISICKMRKSSGQL
jgi:hypothetical protein